MKKKPLINWTLDVGFYTIDIHVKARTKGEARRKALEKLKKIDMKKYINKNTTYLDKSY